MTDQQQMDTLIQGQRACITVHTYEEAYALELVRQSAQSLNKPLWVWSVNEGIVNGFLADGQAAPDTANPAAALTYWKMHHEPAVLVALDLIGHLEDETALRCLRDLIETLRKKSGSLVMIDFRDTLPAVVRAYATPFEISLPDEAELDSIVRDTLRTISRERRIEVHLNRGEYEAILKNLRGLSRRQARRIIRHIAKDDRRLTAQDIHRVVTEKRRALNADGLLEFIETPADLGQIGGLDRLKKWLAVRQGAMTTRGEQSGLASPRGVLLLGVQGAGKSLCAKAIATAWRRPLLRMDPGSLYDRYIGESERRLRDSLGQAEAMSPIVLWIDEIEKGFASAASHSNDGGLSQRMFGTLLTWMQEHTAPVFMVATANDIEALPPELLRKGRFDEIFFVDLPGETTRREIFAIHLRKRNQQPDTFDLAALAGASDGYSGAEIEQAIVSSLYDAVSASGSLTTEMIETTLRGSPPLSVTMEERIAALRQWARGRCVPAD